jgi:hypothetical protein
MEPVDFTQMFEGAKAALETANAKIANLEEELATARAEREAAKQIYNAAAPFVGRFPLPEPTDFLLPLLSPSDLKAAGLSVAVRTILDRHLLEDHTAAQVRDLLTREVGWDWKDYKSNPLPSVYTTLVRLVQSGHAKEGPPGLGTKTFYSTQRPSLRGTPVARTEEPPGPRPDLGKVLNALVMKPEKKK